MSTRAAARLTTSPATPAASTQPPVDARRVREPPDRRADDPHAEGNEHQRVRERGEHLRPPPAEAPLGVAGRLREPGGEEREPERERVREHVRRVGEQRQRPGGEPRDHLHPGESEHERERDRQRPPRSTVRVHAGTVRARISNLFMVRAVAGVTFEGVSKIYPDGTRAVNDLNLEIEDGEFMVLVGPSGCGKTTALRMVAGLEDISEGALQIGDRVVNYVPPRDRDIAMVFQSYALYPHLSVYDNIAFGLKLKKMPKDEIDKRVQDAARILGLEPLLEAQAARALRRPAPARRDGPRDRARAAGVPDGRAALEPRREAARADARRDREAPAATSA